MWVYLSCEPGILKQLSWVFRTYGVTQTQFWDWDAIMALDIGEVSAARSFVFLWCGSSDGLDLGRLCLQNWGFRRSVGWVGDPD